MRAAISSRSAACCMKCSAAGRRFRDRRGQRGCGHSGAAAGTAEGDSAATQGGSMPRWRADGKELYYLAPDLKLMAAAVVAQGASLAPGTPEALFQTRAAITNNNRQPYDVARWPVSDRDGTGKRIHRTYPPAAELEASGEVVLTGTIRQAVSGFQILVRILTKCRSKVQTGASSLRVIRASRASTRVTGWSEYFRRPTVASR